MKGKTAIWRRLLTAAAAVSLIQALLVPAGTGRASAADEGGVAATNAQVEIQETVTDGFIHPGVGLTKTTLETMRESVLAKKEPWYSYYQAMTVSSSAAKTVTSSNQSTADPAKPASDAFNSQGFNSRFIADGLKAYTQALMYYITSDEIYRANAMHIIRIWSQMDPAKYVYFTDSHIHTGIPLNRMVAAAEILRYTSSSTPELAWTDSDTSNFTDHLITPVIETFQHNNNRFMNQHNYPLLGAMAGYIFTNNTERYEEAVEWFTVNATAVNQGFNGSVKQLFRWVDVNAATGEPVDEPYVQHVEMGRDQAHGGGDLTNAAIISRMLLAQGTQVDPVEGTVSTAANAVGPYEFLNDRILAAADYFWQYMLGYDTPWTPVPYSYDKDGKVKGIYNALSDSYRGRMTTANFWDLYYYYTYEKGINLAEKAPYFYEAFTKRIPSNYYHQGAFKQNWDNVDGGGDFWLYMPEQAETEGSTYLPKEQPSAALVEIEDRYTVFDNNTVTRQEGGTAYVEVTATAEGSTFVIQNLSYADRTNSRLIGLRFRTNGTAALQLSKEMNSAPYHNLTLPDTDGQWRYITYDMGLSRVSYGQLDNDYNLLYMKVIGGGTTVDLDHFNVLAGQQLTPPAFQTGSGALSIVAVAGSPVVLSFTADDAGAAETITYEGSGLPQAAELNADTGMFSWQPAGAGTYSFVIGASDGTTVATKNVRIVVTQDRNSAVQAAIAAYDSSTSYTAASLAHFQTVQEETLSLMQTASDAAFFEQLITLKKATEDLQLLTPLLNLDGSMNYANLVTSTFGNAISLLVDGNNNTFPVYTLAPYPDLYHILDFGPDYKISAHAFSLQSRMNFVDRMAGSAVFGSNDKENWTRLTPEETPFTGELARLEVDDALTDQQFRFIKIQLLHPWPDVLSDTVGNMLELGEFRIFGERHEAVNKLSSVSISSGQSVQNRITLGDTAKVTFSSTENIRDVKVVIQGRNAEVQTADQKSWTASAVMGSGAAAGKIKFSITYKTADGADAEPVFFTTDGSMLYLVDRSNLIQVARLASVVASDPGFGTGGLPKDKIGYLLFDGNTATFGDINASSGSYYTVDFGADSSVRLNGIMLMPRATFPGRMNGMVVQGSNDNQNWTNLTRPASGTVESTWSYIGEEQLLNFGSYRYIRLYNASSWFGNVAEVELYGEYQTQNLEARMLPPAGYTQGSYYLYKKEVQHIAELMNQPGADRMLLLQQFLEADRLLVSTSTLPMEKIAVVPSMAAASTVVWGNGGTKEVNGWRAFDGDLNTFTDTTANPSWISIDFGEGSAQALGALKFHPRKGNDSEIKRVNGAVLQGSHDGVNYTNLYTISGISTAAWSTAPIAIAESFRYLRYYAPTGNSNVAELEFYKQQLDWTLLELFIAEAANLDAAKYVEDSYAAVQEAVLQAASVQGNTNSTQVQIDEAANRLLSAMEKLVLKRTIIRLDKVSVSTIAGTAPVLPSVVNAVYSDQTEQEAGVKWEEISPEQYAAAGGFTVTGAVYGTELKARADVTVRAEDAPAEDTAPTAPSNLRAVSVTADSLVLQWDASVDDSGISRYEIYQGDTQAGTVTGDTYSYSFTGLTADTAYTFKVVAFDASDQHTASASYTVKTAGLPQPGDEEGNPGTPENNGNSSTPGGGVSPVPDVMEVTISGAVVKVKPVVQEGTAAIYLGMDILSTMIASASRTGEPALTIDMKGGEAVSSISVELPTDAWLLAKQKGIASVIITSGLVSLNLPTDVLGELKDGGKVSITVNTVSPSELAAPVSMKFQGMPVLDFGLRVNGQDAGMFQPDSLVEVSLPYTLKAGELARSLVAANLNGKGEYRIVRNAKYNPKAGMLVFKVVNFSQYAVLANPVRFDDLGSYLWADDSIAALAARQIVNGTGEGKFAPQQAVTRAEFLKLVIDAYDLTKQGHPPAFTDARAGEWYSDALATAQSMHIAAGYEDGSFGVHQAITRQDMAVLTVRILQAAGVRLPQVRAGAVYEDAPQIAGYAADSVLAMSEAGWLEGRGAGSFAPEAHATRAEAAVLIARMLGLNE